MDTLSQETFDQILKMDKDSLSEDQLGFLMARRGYMNDEQRARFEKEIKLHEAGKLFGGNTEVADEDLDSMTVPNLKKLAEKLEIEGAKDMKKPELIEAIKEARADQE